ncbi:MAG TPA: hypothetical protein VGK10_11900 [Prolixibacteraceae bacterium]|jgi:IMP dehydrogenase
MSFFTDKVVSEGLSSDQVQLMYSYSEVSQNDIERSTWFSPGIRSVTAGLPAFRNAVNDPEMVLAIDRMGAIGVIYKIKNDV